MSKNARWLVLTLILAALLSGCYRSAGGSLEPTPSNINVTQVANNTPIPMPTFTPQPEETEEAIEEVTEEVVEPTAEEMTDLPSPVLPSPTEAEAVATQPEEDTAIPTQEEAVIPSGPSPTRTAVAAVMAPSFTPVPPTQVIAQPTQVVLPSATPTVAVAASVTPTPPPSLTPVQLVPAGPTATFTSVPFNRPAPTATYTPFVPPQEAQPLGERPTDTVIPGTTDGQGGPLLTETPQAVGQVPTLTTNQMTATAIIAAATATGAAAQGTIVATVQTVPGQVTPLPPGITPSATIAAAATAVPGQCNTHLISPGETLSRIALTYNVTVQQIAQANNIVNPDLILAGDTISIPCPVPATPGAPAATVAPGGTTTGTGPFNYIVEPGDNLYRISLRYGVSMAALMQANGLTPATINTIYAGQQLYIPAATTTVQQPAAVTPLPTATLQPTG